MLFAHILPSVRRNTEDTVKTKSRNRFDYTRQPNQNVPNMHIKVAG